MKWLFLWNNSLLLNRSCKVEGSPEQESTGDGTLPSKLQEFKLALVALGEGFLINGGRVNGHPDPVNNPNAAAVRITTELPCQLQVCYALLATVYQLVTC